MSVFDQKLTNYCAIVRYRMLNNLISTLNLDNTASMMFNTKKFIRFN